MENKRTCSEQEKVKRLLMESMKKVAQMQDGVSEIDKAFIAGRVSGMIDVLELQRPSA